MDPFSWLCIGAVVGLVGGGSWGCWNGVAEHKNVLERACDKKTITALRAKLKVACQAQKAPQPNTARRTNTSAEFADPIKYMINMVNDTPEVQVLRDRASVVIDQVLAQENPAEADLNSALMWAVRLGSKQKFIDYIDALVIAGADINHKDSTGECPLSFATFFCVSGAVQKLLAYDEINLDLLIHEQSLLYWAQTRKEKLDTAIVDPAYAQNRNALMALKAYQKLALNILSVLEEKLGM